MPDFPTLLRTLPGSFSGAPSKPAPYAVHGLGEGALAAELLQTLIERRLTSQGTQFILASSDWEGAADDYANIAEASGATPARLGEGNLEKLSGFIPSGVLATYHYAQWVAHASGHAAKAHEADRLMHEIAERCAPEVQDGNPARELAWSLWTRVPLLLAPQGDEFLVRAWQLLLARIGKSLSVPVDHNPLYVLTGAFEARHESGDGRIALILGEEDGELALAREVLETRVDEVVHVPFPSGSEGYAGSLALWYFGAWVAYYLAERYGVSPGDPKALREVVASLSERRSDLN